jgi:Flp pilus assembly protein TadD
MAETLQALDFSEVQVLYQAASSCLNRGEFDVAERLWHQLLGLGPPKELMATTFNDMAVLQAARGDLQGARELFQKAIQTDDSCKAARTNLDLIQKS